MGFLSALGMGGSAAGAAGASTLTSAIGTSLGAAGDITSGIGQSQLANYQASLATINAGIARQNAQAAFASGAYEEAANKLRTGQLVSEQRAAQGANGVDVAIGSAPAVRESTQAVGTMDAAMIHYNAARAAYGSEIEATSLDAQAKLDRMAGTNALIGAGFKAATTVLGGATSLSSKWSQYKLAFGQPGGG